MRIRGLKKKLKFYRKEKTLVSFRVDEELLQEFDRFARKEFGSRSKALKFLISVYVELNRPNNVIQKMLEYYSERGTRNKASTRS